MGSAILTAVVIMGALIAIGYAGFQALERESKAWLAGCLALITISLSAAIYGAMKADESGPCLREETGYMYNAGTKTTMPYTYCAERGTWTDGGAR